MKCDVTRRKKTFTERRQELIGSRDILSRAIRDFKQSGEIHWLREVAVQLRALVVQKPGSPSLKHPLLIELSAQKGFALTVYTMDEDVVETARKILGSSVEFFSTGDILSLDKIPPYSVETTLE